MCAFVCHVAAAEVAELILAGLSISIHAVFQGIIHAVFQGIMYIQTH
jgi:hypothetical protein